MDLILLVSIMSLVLVGILYIRFHRFEKKMTKEEGRILSRTKKQAEMIVDVAHTEEGELDAALSASRKKMIAAFEAQTAKDAKRIESELDSRLTEYVNMVFSKADSAVAESLKKTDADIAAYKKQKIETLDSEVHSAIKKAAKTSIAKGLSLEVHEKIVEQALKEAISEITV